MYKSVAAIIICSSLAGCVSMAGMLQPKERIALEQRAIRNAITLCKKFGHAEGSREFTRCAEERYDEFVINNR